MFRLLTFVLLVAVTSYHVIEATNVQADLPLTNVGGKNYYIDKKVEKSWADARDFCASNDMKLLSLETDQELQALEPKLNATSSGISGLFDQFFWTSGSDETQEGTWKWTATDKKVSHKDVEGFYAIPEYNCMIVFHDGSRLKYLDSSCLNKFFFICEA